MARSSKGNIELSHRSCHPRGRLTHPGSSRRTPLAYPGAARHRALLDLMIHDLLGHSPSRAVADRSIDAVGVAVLSKGEDIATPDPLRERLRGQHHTSRISRKDAQERVFQEDTYISLDYQNQSGEIYKKLSRRSSAKVPLEKEEPLRLELYSLSSAPVAQGTGSVSGEQGARRWTWRSRSRPIWLGEGGARGREAAGWRVSHAGFLESAGEGERRPSRRRSHRGLEQRNPAIECYGAGGERMLAAGNANP